MKTLFISSFRTNNKEKHIKLDCIDTTYFILINYLVKERTITSDKLFPGDDRSTSTSIVERSFKAKLQSETQLEKIRELISATEPVIEINYHDSGHHHKDSRYHYILDSIEFREKSTELKEIENALNKKLDDEEKSRRDYLDDMNFLSNMI